MILGGKLPWPTPRLRTRAAADGPDFLCVGQMKAATGWLYDQLQFHPDFWMPPFKEFHYFDKAFPSQAMLELRRAARADLEALNARRRAKTLRPLDGRDLDFLEIMAAAGEAGDLDRYAALFGPKGGRISGDITPAYSTLEDPVVAALAGRFPELRILLLVRDPVERMWSQINATAQTAGREGTDLTRLDDVRRIMRLPQVQARSRPTLILGRWLAHFGESRIHVAFFDDVAADPAAARAGILRFLGADPRRGGGEVAPDFNRKSEHRKVAMTPQARALLVEDLGEELEACARVFGRPAEAWLARARTPAEA